VWSLPEEHIRRSRDSLKLPPEGHSVEVRLQDLHLGPAPFHGPGGPHLAPFLREGSGPAAAAQARGGQRRKLHGDRAGAPRGSAGDVLEQGGDQGLRIHAAVTVEPPILGGQHGGPQGGGNLREAHPGEPPRRLADPEFMQHFAVSVQELHVRRVMGQADRLEGGYTGRGRPEDRPEPCPGGEDRDQAGPANHGRTSSGALGNSPNISGAYRASTRVVGS
jgi:hypothetical protein